MKIELKKIQISLAHSEETILFNAEIYVNGIAAGYAKNDGRGGNTWYHANEGKRDLIRQAEEFCSTLPSIKFPATKNMEAFEVAMSLEHFIDTLVEAELDKKEHKKLEKKMVDTIMWGVPNSGSYSQVRFRVPLDKIPAVQLQTLIDKYKKELKQGEVFLNTNLVTLGVKL